MAAGVAAGAVLGSGASFGGEGTAGGTGFDVGRYDVTVDYRPDSGTIRGVAVVDATAADALERFTLNLDGPVVRSVTVDSRAVASFSQVGEEELVIVPATAIERGARFRVRVEYDGTPGAGWLPTVSGGATAFEGSSSAWFPAHEDARDKADFRLTATVPDGWGVVSVGREVEVRREGATDTFGWVEADVDPAHIAVSIDRFTIERSTLADGTPVVNAYAPGVEEATRPLAGRLPEVLGFLSGAFGPYPFRAAGNVFVQVDDDGPATSPQTRPVFLGAGNERFMTLDAVVHEQAHQWYGVAAAAREPEDMCLAECFAVYSTWLWDEAEDGADLDARYREAVEAEMDDAGFWGERLYQSGVAPGIGVYTKSPLAVHALRRQIGEEAFHRLIRRWPQEHRGDYAGWPQFEAFAEEVAGQDLSGFFEAWFRGATVPGEEYLWPGTLAR